MASRKLKMHKLVGRLKGFIPNINDGKFPNASQIDKIFSKNQSFRVIIEDPTYFNLYPYRMQKDEAKSILSSIKNKNQPQWHMGLKIQIVYSIGDADVRWLKNGQVIDTSHKHKATKSDKASMASAKASNEASAKSQSASYSFMASIKNSMQVDRANFSASARFAMRSHDKTASQLSTESKQFVSSEAFEAKSLIDSRADSTLSHSIASSDANQFNGLSHPDDMFQAPGMMQGDFMASISMPQSNDASSESASASVSASQSASKSASVSASKSQSTSASKATSLSESASLSQSVSALSAKSEAVKKSKSASKASASQAKSSSAKASSASASKASSASSKASSVSESIKVSKASASASKSNSQEKSQASSLASSKASSASASKSASVSAVKSMEAQQAQKVKESNEKLKRAEELKRKNQAPDTISTVKTFLHDHKLHHGKTQNDHIMDAYEKLLKHKNNHTTHWDRAGLNKIYKMEGWNDFFKKNEQDAITKIDHSVDQILTSPAVTYPLSYNILPNIQMIQRMAKAQPKKQDSANNAPEYTHQHIDSDQSNHDSYTNEATDEQSTNHKIPSRMSKLHSERRASNGGFNYKSFINQDDKLANKGSTSSKSYSQASNSSSGSRSKVQHSKLPHTLTPYK